MNCARLTGRSASCCGSCAAAEIAGFDTSAATPEEVLKRHASRPRSLGMQKILIDCSAFDLQRLVQELQRLRIALHVNLPMVMWLPVGAGQTTRFGRTARLAARLSTSLSINVSAAAAERRTARRGEQGKPQIPLRLPQRSARNADHRRQRTADQARRQSPTLRNVRTGRTALQHPDAPANIAPLPWRA